MNNLCCQARSVIQSHLLTDLELEELQQVSQQQSMNGEILELPLGSLSQEPVSNKQEELRQGSQQPSVNGCSLQEISDAVNVLTNDNMRVSSPLEHPIQHSSDGENNFETLLLYVNQCLLSDDNTAELKTAFSQLNICLLEIGSLKFDIRQALPRVCETPTTRHWLTIVNDCINRVFLCSNLSLMQCDCLVYAGALTVVKLSGLSDKSRGGRCKKNGWRVRLESKIQNMRGHLSQLVAICQSTVLSVHLQRVKFKLFRIYHITDRLSLLSIIETLKQRITAFAGRLRKYRKRLQRHWQNRTFCSNQKTFYRRLCRNVTGFIGNPDSQQVLLFWRSLFEKNSDANLNSVWLSQLKEKFAVDLDFQDVELGVNIELFVNTLNRLQNWASPGPDGIHGYWWKKMTSTHKFLCLHFHQFLRGGELLPPWFPRGRTLLLPKCNDLSAPQNFRPITCLNIVYKLWTGCLASLMYDHCEKYHLIHPAQKGCSRGQYGCVDHLLLTNGVWHQVRSKYRSLSVAWLDYRKAYDSVPHNWLLERLRLFHFPSMLITCIEQLMPLWETFLFLCLPDKDPLKLSNVSVKCGIYQGDTLSPLLFCLCLNPLSYMLDGLKGYKMSSTGNLTHLLYMDDIKLFAQNDAGLQKMVDLVRKFSDDIRMSFGISKCAKLTVKRGKPVSTGPILTIGDEIGELSCGETYRYLGFVESGGVDHSKCKDIISAEFLRRLKLVWRSLLHGRFKVQATNGFCVPLLSYGFGIVEWTKGEICHFDVLTRKILTSSNSHHPRSAIEHLYLPRYMGGRGLVSIEHLYQRRLLMMSQHFQTSCDPLVRECFNLVSQIPSSKSLVTLANQFAADLNLNSVKNFSTGQLKKAVCSAQ